MNPTIKKMVPVAMVLAVFFLAACSAPETPQEASTSISSPAAPAVSQPKSESVDEPYASPIDFANWQGQNTDIYAWVRIADTNVDYPVVQSSVEDEYYLRRDIQGKDSIAGSIFTQATYNQHDFDDSHTVMYGHNMESLDGSMFSDVHRYQNQDFFDSHREIVIYLPEKELHYRVFAAYEWSDEHLLYTYNSHNPEVYQNYLDSILTNRNLNAIIDDSVTLTAEQKIITLSTCSSTYPTDTRFLVQAVLESEVPSNE